MSDIIPFIVSSKTGEKCDYTWNSTTRTFVSHNDHLIIQTDQDDIIFHIKSNCTITTGNRCEIHALNYGIFKTGQECKFYTDHSNTFNTGPLCQFITDRGCIFTTGHSCYFITKSACVFITHFGCVFKTGSQCSFNTGDSCSFNTGESCMVNIIFGTSNTQFIKNSGKVDMINPLRLWGFTIYRNDDGFQMIHNYQVIDGIDKIVPILKTHQSFSESMLFELLT